MTNPSPGLPHPVRRVIPDRQAGSELLRLPRTVQTNAASRPPTAKQCGELLRLPRVNGIAPMQSGDCFSYRNAGSKLIRLPKPVRRVIPDRQAMRRVNPLIVPTSAASFPSTAAPGTSSHGFPEQCDEFPIDRRSGNEFPRLPRTVRRVSHRPPLRERVPTASQNSATSFTPTAAQGASFSGFPE